VRSSSFRSCFLAGAPLYGAGGTEGDEPSENRGEPKRTVRHLDQQETCSSNLQAHLTSRGSDDDDDDDLGEFKGPCLSDLEEVGEHGAALGQVRDLFHPH
jgi:hypothetical protein